MRKTLYVGTALTMVTAALLLAVPSAHAQQGTTKHPWASKPHTVNLFSEPFWKAARTPEILLQVLQNIPEPYTPPMPDALEAALPKLTTPRESTIAAAILYRYGRQSGYDSLARRVEANSDAAAATVLALNHDTRMIGPITRILGKETERDRDLILALGGWNSPQVTDALWKAFQQTPRDTQLTLALGKLDAKEAIPLIRSLYFSSAYDKTTRIAAGAALISLGGAGKTPRVLQFLIAELKPGPLPKPPADEDVDDNRGQVADAFGYLRIAQGVPALQGLVRYYVEHGSSIGPGGTGYGLPEDLAALAGAQALGEIGDASSSELLFQLLGRFQRDQADPAQKAAVIRSLLSLNADPVRLQKMIGKQSLERERQKQKLKVLPEGLMPSGND